MGIDCESNGKPPLEPLEPSRPSALPLGVLPSGAPMPHIPPIPSKLSTTGVEALQPSEQAKDQVVSQVKSVNPQLCQYNKNLQKNF